MLRRCGDGAAATGAAAAGCGTGAGAAGGGGAALHQLLMVHDVHAKDRRGH